MSDDLEDDEDNAKDQPDQPHMQLEDNFEGLYTDDPVPLPLPHVEVAHPEPDPGNIHVEPLLQAGPDEAHNEVDVQVCFLFS